MIQSKADLKEYLAKDKFALHMTRRRPKLLGEPDEIWRFQIVLRKHEYYRNCTRNIFMKCFYGYLHLKMGYKLGFNVPCNTFKGGLHLLHAGMIGVNNKARIGEWCDVCPGVIIAQNIESDSVPVIGDHVWIGSGAKIFGKIVLGDNMMIGANAVVCKSFPQGNVRLAGNPAEIVSEKGNAFYQDTHLFEQQFHSGKSAGTYRK